MRAMRIPLVCVIAAAGLWGCTAPAPSVDDLGVAPMLHPPGPWSVQAWPEVGKPSTRPDPNAPQVQVELRFVCGTVGDLRKAGLSVEGDHAVLPKDKLAIALDRRTPPTAGAHVLMAPRLTAFSGQEVVAFVGSTADLVTDHRYVPDAADKDGPLRPVVSKLTWGMSACVSARTEGDRVVVTKLQLLEAQALDLRPCSAIVRYRGKDLTCSWHEPVVLVGKSRLETPCGIALKADECVVVPLAYELEACPPAMVRMLTRGGAVTVRSAAQPRSPGAASEAPANRQVVVLVSARRV